MKRIIITEKQLHSIVGNTINEDVVNNDIKLSKDILDKIIEILSEDVYDVYKEYNILNITIDSITPYYFEFKIKVYHNKTEVYQGNYYERSEYRYSYDVSIEDYEASYCIDEDTDEWVNITLSSKDIFYLENNLSKIEYDF